MLPHDKLARVIRFGIYGIFLISPFLFLKTVLYGFVVPRAVFFMFMVQLVLFLWVLLITRDRTYRPRLNKISIALLVFLGVLVLTAFLGYDPMQSFFSTHQRMTGIFFLFHVVALAGVMASVFRTRQNWHTLFKVNVLAGLGFALLLFLGPHAINLFSFFDANEGGATIGNTSFAATYLLFITWISLLVSFRATSRSERVLGIGGFFFLLINPLFFNFTIFTGQVSLQKILEAPTSLIGHGKAATLSLVGGLILFWILILMHRTRKKWMTILGITLIAGGLIAFLSLSVQLFHDGSQVRDFFISETSETRLVVWDMAWKGFLQDPLTGVGLENFDLVYQEQFDPYLFSDELREKNWFDHAHNIILELLATTGILGLLAYMALIGIIMVSLVQIYMKRRDLFPEVSLTALMVITYSVQNLTVFDTVTSYRMFALVLGFVLWLYVYAGLTENIKEVEKKPRHHQEALRKKSKNSSTYLLWGTGIVTIALFYSTVVLPFASSRHVYRALTAPNEVTRMYHYERLARNPFAQEAAFRSILGRTTQSLASNTNILNGTKRESVARQLDRLTQYVIPIVDNHPREYRLKLILVDLFNLITALGSPRTELAHKYAQELVEYVPTNPFGYLTFAQVLVFQGNIDGARELLRTIQEIQPNSEAINSALDYVNTIETQP